MADEPAPCRECGELPDVNGLCRCGRQLKAALELNRIQETIDRTGYCPLHGRWHNADRCPECGAKR